MLTYGVHYSGQDIILGLEAAGLMALPHHFWDVEDRLKKGECSTVHDAIAWVAQKTANGNRMNTENT